MTTFSSAALITGGGSGLGAACVRHFATRFDRVIAADLQFTAAAQFASEAGPAVQPMLCDVTSADNLREAIEKATDDNFELRATICCAGVLAAAKVVGTQGPHDLEIFRRVLEINLLGTFNTARLAAAAMLHNTPDENSERGVIVLTSSIAAEEGQIGQAAYAASKGGVAALVLPMARELGRHGIRVVGIAPGVFDTSLMRAVTPAMQQALCSQIPFPPRFGQPEEFAQLVAHVLENHYLNGVVLRLDGGLRMPAR